MATIRLAINGKNYSVDTDPQTSLLPVLREELDLTGSKYGCGEGLCGACTVLIDGKAQRSCITRVASVSGKQITTIEGLATWRSSASRAAGFSRCRRHAVWLLHFGDDHVGGGPVEENPEPSERDIVDFMDGNVCRCGTYSRIVSAIQKAAELPMAAAAKGGTR